MFQLLPIPKNDVMEILRNHQGLTLFTTMIEAAGLDQELSLSLDEEDSMITVFAPDNEAIEQNLDIDAQRTLLNDKDKLTAFVRGHFVKGYKTTIAKLTIVICNNFQKGFVVIKWKAKLGSTETHWRPNQKQYLEPGAQNRMKSKLQIRK